MTHDAWFVFYGSLPGEGFFNLMRRCPKSQLLLSYRHFLFVRPKEMNQRKGPGNEKFCPTVRRYTCLIGATVGQISHHFPVLPSRRSNRKLCLKNRRLIPKLIWGQMKSKNISELIFWFTPAPPGKNCCKILICFKKRFGGIDRLTANLGWNFNFGFYAKIVHQSFTWHPLKEPIWITPGFYYILRIGVGKEFTVPKSLQSLSHLVPHHTVNCPESDPSR